MSEQRVILLSDALGVANSLGRLKDTGTYFALGVQKYGPLREVAQEAIKLLPSFVDDSFVKKIIDRERERAARFAWASIFHPEDPSGYGVVDYQERITQSALTIFPGAKGDRELALCMMVHHLQSTIIGAKARYEKLPERIING